MYKEIELKLNYHKEKIIESFIRSGIYPDNSLIESKLLNIELRLAIFKNYDIKEGTNVNIDYFNNNLKLIYDDIKILYELLYQVNILEYNSLKLYIDSHINELQEVADSFLKKAELESFTTSLGTSLLYKYNNFDIDMKDNITIIDLGQIEVCNADRIACITNINNIDYKDIVLKMKSTDNIYSCNVYNYNHDTLLMPGKKNTIIKEVVLNNNQIIKESIELPIKIESKKSRCFTLAGKDKILYKKANTNGEIVEEKPVAINSLNFDSRSFIDFYVVDGAGISFRFNKKPLATNFNINSNKIENLDYIQHFFIECDENFSFDIELDKGSLYAFKERTLIEKETVYYSGKLDLRDFIIIEEIPGNPSIYNCTLEINGSIVEEDDIKGIIIKKI